MAHTSRTWAIGVATRQRREMVSQLLEALLKLKRPSDVSLVFILVENEPQLSLTDIVAAFRTQLTANDKVVHACETRLGIPFARNRVLQLAQDNQCELLAFLDDDVIPEPEWLMELVNELETSGSDLVGGPVRLAPVHKQQTNLENRLVWRGLNYRFKRIEFVAAQYRQYGRADKVTVITSSWLAKLSFLEKHHLKFDESMGLSGGSDSRFFRELRAAGGKTGWAPRAIVCETWPVSRLTLLYQYSRGRDQAISHFYNKYPHVHLGAWLNSAVFIASKWITGVLFLPLACLGIGSAATGVARSIGMSVGRIRALAGYQSAHYQTVASKQL